MPVENFVSHLHPNFRAPLPPSLGALTEFKPVEVDWHTAAEWGYLFKGSCRISTVDTKGKTFIDDIDPGDLWSALCLPATSPSLMVRIQVLPVRNSPQYSSFWRRGRVPSGEGPSSSSNLKLEGVSCAHWHPGRIQVFDDGTFSEDATLYVFRFLLLPWDLRSH